MEPFALALGKLPAKSDRRTLRLARYLDRDALPKPPQTLDLTSYVRLPWPMDGNDRVGDCVVASAAHQVQLWSAMVGRETVFPEQLVVQTYFSLTGGQDTGLEELSFLNYWRQVGLGGQHILAFASVTPTRHVDMKLALELFGGIYLGVSLPQSAQAETGPGKTWRSHSGGAGRPGTWGGHAVPVVAYDTHGLTCVTWGFLQHLTWPFVAKYCDEAWALLPQDFAVGGNPASGFRFDQLQEDLSKIGQER